MGELQQQTSSQPSCPEQREARKWIAGRIATLLAHYWREDSPSELTAAIARDWIEVLEGLPQEAIQRACIRYQREEPRRRPTPGAIYAMARDAIPKPTVVRPFSAMPPAEPPPRVTPERAREIMQEFGFSPKRFGGSDE